MQDALKTPQVLSAHVSLSSRSSGSKAAFHVLCNGYKPEKRQQVILASGQAPAGQRPEARSRHGPLPGGSGSLSKPILSTFPRQVLFLIWAQFNTFNWMWLAGLTDPHWSWDDTDGPSQGWGRSGRRF